jgi:hypothetical protein
MATTTTGPRRRLSRLPQSRTYDSLASKYSSVFKNALEQQQSNDIKLKVDQFKLGQISYEVLKKYMEDTIKTLPDGSSKKTEYTGLLVEAEKYNKQMINTNEKTKVDALRTKLLESFKGRITTKDELNIVRQLKASVNPNTDVYNDLTVEEAKLKNQTYTEGAGLGKKTIKDKLDRYFAEVAVENKQIQEDYQSGKITGYEADNRLYQNGIEMNKALEAAANQGVDIPSSYFGSVAEVSSALKNKIAQRETGLIFDVVDKQGKVQSVTHQELENDKLKTSPDFLRSKYSIEPVAAGSSAMRIVDSETGQPIKGKIFTSETDAKKYVASLQEKEGYSVVVPQQGAAGGPATTKQFNFNPKIGGFTPLDNPSTSFYSPVATGFESRFQVQKDVPLQNFIQNQTSQINKYYDTNTQQLNLEQMQSDLNPKEVMGPPSPFIGPEKTGTTGSAITLLPETSTSAKLSKTTPASKQNMSFNPTGMFNTIGPTLNPNGFSKSGSSSLNLNIPGVNVKDFNLPSFNLSPSGLGPFNNQNPMDNVKTPNINTSGSNQGFGSGILNTIKNLGNKAIGAIKGLFNF